MADKLRTTFPISVDFVDGELPTAMKMNGLARQAKNGQTLLDYAIGDVWNQAGDPILTSVGLSTNALMIPNLARYLGATKFTSPRIPYLPNIQRYYYSFQLEAGGREATLTFPVKDTGTTFNWSGTTCPSGAPKASKGLVLATGDWYVNRETGCCYFFDFINADWMLEYEPVVDGDIGSNATFNVIPDLDTDPSYGFQSLKIIYANGTDNTQGFIIYLPPRGPLNNRNLNKFPQDDSHAPAHLNNFSYTPTSTTDRRFWQTDTTTATLGVNGNHYRYNLPLAITDGWSSGAVLPQGLLYLWDPINTGTILSGVVFSAESAATPRKYYLRATGTSLSNWINGVGSSVYTDLMLKSSSHATTYYPSNGLRLITIGSDISQLVSELLTHFWNHNHSTSSSMPTLPVSHKQLTDTMDTFDGFWRATDWTNDDHPQYFHRHGSGAPGDRDPYSNGIRNDLLLLSSNSSSYCQNITAYSRAIVFGSLTEGAKINLDPAVNNRISLEWCKSVAVGKEGGMILRDSSGTIYLDFGLDSAASGVSGAHRHTIKSSGDLYIQALNPGVPPANGRIYLNAAGDIDLVSADDIELSAYDRITLATNNDDIVLEPGTANNVLLKVSPGQRIYTNYDITNYILCGAESWTWFVDDNVANPNGLFSIPGDLHLRNSDGGGEIKFSGTGYLTTDNVVRNEGTDGISFTKALFTTTKGERGCVWSNQYKTGAYNDPPILDGGYGYGYNDVNYLGPIKILNIPAHTLTYAYNHDGTIGGFVLSDPEAWIDGDVIVSKILNPTFLNYSSYAYGTIDLPFAFAIVNIAFRVNPINSNLTAANNWYFNFGTQDTATRTITWNTPAINIRNAIGSDVTKDTWSAVTNMYPIDPSINGIRAYRGDPDSNSCVVFRIWRTNTPAAAACDLSIPGFRVYYRVKEY